MRSSSSSTVSATNTAPTTATLAFWGLSLFLVLFPLTLVKPGWPSGLKSDEPAYYLMALSLAHDLDVRVDLGDLRRLFDEFPDHPAQNVILMTDDGWHTVYFGKPYIYSLFAAPWAGLFGANGLLFFNMALYLAMVGLGWRYLRRFNADGVALLFAGGFFLLSAGFAYVFWLHPEVFNMAAITACLYLGLTEPQNAERFRPRSPLALLRQPLARAFFSCAALSLAVYNKPMLAAIGLAVFFRYAQKRRFKELGAWLAGGAVGLLAIVGGSLALTGHASAYLGVARAGVKICSPHEMPIEPLAPPPALSADEGSPEKGSLADERRASWTWLLRLPPFHPPTVLEHLGYFLWGRHTGLFLYFPFSLLALVFFFVHARRSAVGWALLLSLAGIALFFLLWIPFNWHGGGGFVGNRYFVNVYPGFLFLVTRLAPAWLQLLGFAAGGLLLGPTIFTPLGRSVPWPTLQAHVRNFPFPHFPLELGIKGIPGYHEQAFSGARFLGRKDVFLPRGTHAWVGGATEVELWIQTAEPQERFVFRVESPAASNEIALRLGDDEERLVFAAGEDDARRQLTLEPGAPDRTLERHGAKLYFYRLVIQSRGGEVREWTKQYPPRDCFYFPYAPTSIETFYVGAEMAYLGSPELLERDLYAVEWGRVEAPESVPAGSEIELTTRVRNASGETWPAVPPTRVNLSYRWERTGGEVADPGGLRTPLDGPVGPGAWAVTRQQVRAPAEPGDWVLVLDLVYEGVAWFSQKNGDNVVRLPIEVRDPGVAEGAPEDV